MATQAVRPLCNMLGVKLLKNINFSLKSNFKGNILHNKSFHSKPKVIDLVKMKIKVLPALFDNYMYLIVDEETKKAAAVDPVEVDIVMKAVEEEEAELTTVLTTHHHYDHSAGNEKILQKLPRVEIVGGDYRIPGVNKIVDAGDVVQVGNLRIDCLFTPCHTKGHVCYYIKTDGNPPAVFTGDTLFIAGCGRFFEGTGEEMYKNLVKILGSLPDDTRVYCGHEYTYKNLKFAHIVEPNNKHIEDRLDWAQNKVKNKEPTVPSTIGEEKLSNPFMRVEIQEVQNFAGQKKNPIATMENLRLEKDIFV